MELAVAIAMLDPEVEDHWTADGLPRMDIIHELTDDPTIKREDVTSLAPDLRRETASPIEPAPDGPANFDGDPDEGIEEDLDEDGDEEVGEGDGGDEPVSEPQGGAVPLDVLAMPTNEVLADPDLTEIALVAMEGRINDLLREKTALEDRIKQQNAWNEIIKRASNAHKRAAGSQPNQIQEYLRRQGEARAIKVAQARAFIAGGTTQADVLEQLQTGSKLDRAMARRKPGMGEGRPKPRKLRA